MLPRCIIIIRKDSFKELFRIGKLRNIFAALKSNRDTKSGDMFYCSLHHIYFANPAHKIVILYICGNLIKNMLIFEMSK